MNLLKIILSTSAFAIASVALHAQLPTKVESFPVRDVRLTASPFKHAEDMDIRYLLGIDPDRLLAPYLKEAGLFPKAENYTNWENTGLDGHIGGHYLSALSYMYAATGNQEIKVRLDYMISELKRCQDAAGDGYLCGVPNGRKMWKEIEEGNIRASGFGLNDRWVPLYNIHKMYAGLRDATLQTGSKEAKEMLVKLTDWMIRLISKLSDEQIQDMLRSEHGGLNETFADVAAITGDKRYLKLAHQFSHQTVLQPLLKQEDKLTGMHANTQIPKVIGFKRIADLEGNRDWSEAARYFWETVVDHRSITIGGNSVREHFHPADDFSSMLTAITGDKRYLKLAHQFSHQTVLQPLLKQEDKLTGMHANTQIPKVIGFKRIADLEGNRDWSEAARYFWETVVDHRSITIGGNSVREHFHPADDFSSMLTSEQGPETCNTYNMLRLTKMLYETSADAHLMDYYERALYNHILSTQDPVQGGFVYFTPMRAGHYRVYSQPQTSFWCCVGSGMENHARYGEMIYGHKDNNLYVNLFIPSTLRWGDIHIEQQTAFPDEEGTTLAVSPEKGEKEFALLFRVPEWTNPEALRLSVNGEQQKVTVKEGYVSLNRTWSKGDKVRLELPMHLRAIALPDGSANYSILYGPIVLAAQLGKQNQDGMFADDSRGGHIAAGPRLPLQTMPVMVGDKNDILSHLKKVEGKPLTFALTGVYPERYEGMIVEPFFRLYECRYMVYWPVLSKQELQARQEQLAKEEKERAALDGITTDKVICGEQQPESDHFIRMENSRTGDDEGVHWRETTGWFSYRMKTNGKPVHKVRILFRPEIRKDAKVWINGQEVGKLADKPASDLSVGIVDVPVSMQSDDQLEIKIGRGNEKVTPHIYEVRLVTE